MATGKERTESIWKLRECPRCQRGDLFRDDHSYHCLQCGYIKWDTAPLVLAEHKPKDKIKKEVQQWETG